jgi:hypothetical protein
VAAAPAAPAAAPTTVAPGAMAPTTVAPGPIAAPAHGAAPAPTGSCCGGGGHGAVYSDGCGCDCGATCDCCAKPSLHDRLKARFHRSSCCEDSCDCGCGGGHAAAYSGGCGCDCGATCDCCAKPSLHDRLKARFHRSSCCEDSCGCGDGCCGYGGGAYGGAHGGTISAPGSYPITTPGGVTVPPGAEPIKAPKDSTPGSKLPTGGKTQAPGLTPDLTPTSSRAIDSEAKNPFELDRRYETRVDRAADYSWVTGQLFFVHAGGGSWVLRYAAAGHEDPHGGRVVLAQDRRMDSYRDGDLVTVHGEVLDPKGPVFAGGPVYRALSIQLIDRSNR